MCTNVGRIVDVCGLSVTEHEATRWRPEHPRLPGVCVAARAPPLLEILPVGLAPWPRCTVCRNDRGAPPSQDLHAPIPPSHPENPSHPNAGIFPKLQVRNHPQNDEKIIPRGVVVLISKSPRAYAYGKSRTGSVSLRFLREDHKQDFSKTRRHLDPIPFFRRRHVLVCFWGPTFLSAPSGPILPFFRRRRVLRTLPLRRALGSVDSNRLDRDTSVVNDRIRTRLEPDDAVILGNIAPGRDLLVVYLRSTTVYDPQISSGDSLLAGLDSLAAGDFLK